jgi:hypothetical protein
MVTFSRDATIGISVTFSRDATRSWSKTNDVSENNPNDFVSQRAVVRNALQYPDSPAYAHFDA